MADKIYTVKKLQTKKPSYLDNEQNSSVAFEIWSVNYDRNQFLPMYVNLTTGINSILQH
jgi:hypothetical protein